MLEDPQGAYVTEVARSSERKLLLLSHHQLLSVYDPEDLGPVLPDKLGAVLDAGRVTAWVWGHEHRCMVYDPARGMAFPRCLGHGGVPVLLEHGPDDPIPAPGRWQQGAFLEDRGQRWARFGFAVLDFDAGRIAVRYRDDEGTQTYAETMA